MPEQRPKHNFANLLRFYRYGLPYWRTILVAFFWMTVYSMAAAGSLMMLKPLYDAFNSGSADQEQAAPAPAVPAGAAAAGTDLLAEGEEGSPHGQTGPAGGGL